MSSAVIWHEVECGGYAADLGVWEVLASAAAGPVLELGCGTGRVALRLGRNGHSVWAVDADAPLLAALEAQASRDRLAITTVCADVCSLSLDREFELVIAPMQLIQMLDGRSARQATLERVSAHLVKGGRLAAAIVERPAAVLDADSAALPDVRERGGWVYSSLPALAPTATGDLEIRRLRQAVSPGGSLSEEEHVDRLRALDAPGLEAEAAEVGLRAESRLEVPAADGYLGSTVVVLGGS